MSKNLKRWLVGIFLSMLVVNNSSASVILHILDNHYFVHTQTGILIEDKRDEVLNNRNTKDRKYFEITSSYKKLRGDKVLEKPIIHNFKVNIDNYTYQYEILNNQDKNIILNKINTHTPTLISNKDLNRFITISHGEDIYEIDADSLSMTKLTKDSVSEISKEEYIKTYPKYLIWAANPKISPNGDYFIYFSNKNIDNDSLILSPGIRLFGFEDNQEGLLVSSNMEEIIDSRAYWVDNENIVYTTYDYNGTNRVYKYNILTKERERLIEFPNQEYYINIENGYMIYSTDSDSTNVLDLTNKIEKSFNVSTKAQFGTAISYNGKVALINENNELVIINFKDEKLHIVNLANQNKSISAVLNWNSDTELMIDIYVNEKVVTGNVTEQ